MKSKIKIKWDKNIWYSKTIAFIFFIILICLSFYFGYKYGELKVNERYVPIILSYNFKKPDLYFSTKNNIEFFKNWVVFQDENYGFSFKYPKELELENPAGTWRYFSLTNSLGLELAKVKIPAVYEMNTNFVEAFFKVGLSSSTLDIQNCFLPSSKEESLGTFDIGNKTFYKFKGEDYFSGHYYKIESYKTLHHNICYSLDLIVHYLDAKTLPQFSLKDFDEERVYNLLGEILKSFIFTK